MNIFDFAKKMETDGEKYYRETAAQLENEGMKYVLNMLADDEVKHYNILSRMARSEPPGMTDSEVLNNAKNVFERMKGTSFDKNIGEVELYKKAQRMEKDSVEFYEARASEESNARHKETLLKIAEEEKKHFFLLENIINFVNRPETWIEDAEFNHLEEY